MMALDPNLRDVLQNLKSDITLTVQLPYLLPFLRQKRLVTETEFQQLSSDGKESDSEKNGKLIRIVIGKGEEAFDLFIEALQEEKEHLGHNSLAKRLLHEQNRLKAEASKPRRSRPEPLPRSKKPATPAATLPAKSIDHEPQQVYSYSYIEYGLYHRAILQYCRMSTPLSILYQSKVTTIRRILL